MEAISELRHHPPSDRETELLNCIPPGKRGKYKAYYFKTISRSDRKGAVQRRRWCGCGAGAK